MKSQSAKVLVAGLAGFAVCALLALGMGLVLLRSNGPDLSKAICQAQDIGDNYHPSGRPATLTKPYLDLEGPAAAYTVELVDLQLTNTVLECSIVRYADTAAARRAYQKVCAGQQDQDPVEFGEAACQFPGPAPRNLAFRRDVYLVLMSGDLPEFPAKEVDERLRR